LAPRRTCPARKSPTAGPLAEHGKCAGQIPRRRETKRRVIAGDLPRLAGFRIWSWVSTGRTCDGCGEVVGAAEIQHDVDVGGTVVLRLHPECFRAWSVED